MSESTLRAMLSLSVGGGGIYMSCDLVFSLSLGEPLLLHVYCSKFLKKIKHNKTFWLGFQPSINALRLISVRQLHEFLINLNFNGLYISCCCSWDPR